jgi:outer membrane protein assembly factor BamB
MMRMAGRARGAAVLAVAAAASVALVVLAARAQTIETKRARTIVVGTPRGAAPAERVDGARSGGARAPLPGSTLHVAWRRSLGLPITAAPLVDALGDVTVVAARGDVVVLAGGDGEERAHTLVGAAATSGAALLSDGTVVVMTSQGDVVGVRLGDVRFRARVGGGRTSVAPLALDDGGFVVATPLELLAFDAEGGVRARAAIDAGTAPVALLLGGKPTGEPVVYAVYATTGDVYGWVPASGREPERIGTFRGATDDGAALAADGSLLAVVAGEALVALDPVHGTTTTRASTATTGVLALAGPPATLRGGVALLGLNASRTLALAFDAAGAETLHQAVGPTSLPVLADGGVGHGAVPPHVGPLLDGQGAIAFALPSGEIGVISAAGSVDVVNEVCNRAGAAAGRANATFAGLSPAAPSAMVVACGNGVVARLDDDFAHAAH